jgi:hypothetical protein
VQDFGDAVVLAQPYGVYAHEHEVLARTRVATLKTFPRN